MRDRLELRLAPAEVREATSWRRALHRRPELAFEEFATASFIAERLREMGLSPVEGIAGTGVVAMIDGTLGPGPAIGLRAEMDALAMTETNRFAHASQTPGRMHACGHDGHIAMLLGAARVLARTRAFRGTVVLLFQPAEEGAGGGRAMVDAGILDTYGIERVYSIHNWPELPVGTIGVLDGPVMASCDQWQTVIKGRGGHGAMPHLCVDPVVAGAELVASLQTLISREISPTQPAVVTIAQFHAGSANNVIPDEAVLSGTVRTFDEAVRSRIERRIEEMSKAVAALHHASAEFRYTRQYPVTVNHAEDSRAVVTAARRLVEPPTILTSLPPSMASEDFAFMLARRPGCYIWLGQGGGPSSCMVHNPGYDFNDGIIELGVQLWIGITQHWLGVS
jgi:hippurate hydrolase